MEINLTNAIEHNDNFAIYDSSGGLIGMEHNRSEADKYKSWFSNRHGMRVAIRENNKDEVRMALQIRPEIVRFKHRTNIIYASK